jgi:hypothetical protein
VQVVGKVAKISLRPDKVACVALVADVRGIATVECRCMSDAVLRLVKVGSAATLEGVCAGMEDSVTLVMERCDLIDVQAPAPLVWQAPPEPRKATEQGPSAHVSAVELFEQYSADKEWALHGAAEKPFRVTGTVVKVFLRHDGAACIALAAESRGVCTVQCRCISDEVLLRVVVGSTVTLDGVCQGLEDSLTLIMERCELAA